nr:hypothetical protein [Propionicimonas sp.]
MKRLLALAGLLLTGCATVTPAQPAASPPPPTQVASREAQGGLCVSGQECRSLLTVRSDGTWVLEGAEDRTGTLEPDQLTRLQDAAARTTMAAALPFTGTCPTAWDGQEYTYTWTSGDQRHTVASCDREVDPADPLVTAFEELVADLGRACRDLATRARRCDSRDEWDAVSGRIATSENALSGRLRPPDAYPTLCQPLPEPAERQFGPRRPTCRASRPGIPGRSARMGPFWSVPPLAAFLREDSAID